MKEFFTRFAKVSKDADMKRLEKVLSETLEKEI